MTNRDLIWKALADPTRRDILDQLIDGPLTTGEVVERNPHLCRTAVMKHLDILEGADLLVVKREGRFRRNYLNAMPIQRICERWIQRHTRHLASAMSRLKDHVETPSEETDSGD